MKLIKFWLIVIASILLLNLIITLGTFYIYKYLLDNEHESILNETNSICNTAIASTKLEFTGAINVLISLRELVKIYPGKYVDPVSWNTWVANIFEFTSWGISGLLQLIYTNDIFEFRQFTSRPIRSFQSNGIDNNSDHLAILNTYPTLDIIGLDFFTEPVRNETSRKGIAFNSATVSDPFLPVSFSSSKNEKFFFFFLPSRSESGTLLGGVTALYSEKNAIPNRNTLPKVIVFKILLNGIPLLVDNDYDNARFISSSMFQLRGNTSSEISCGTTRNDSFSSKVVLIIGAILFFSCTVVGFSIAFIILKKKKSEEHQKETEEREVMAVCNSQQKTAFLANMSHEIRTPINGIVGMTNFLLETKLSEEQENYTNVLKQSAEVLLSIVNDILDFSKMQAGKLRVENVAFDIGSFLTSVKISFDLESKDRGNTLYLKTFFKDHFWIYSDPHRLRQILGNLVSNALKFTSQGIITLSLDFADPYLIFSVSDTGIGMTEPQMKLLFTPFNQADDSTTRKYGGTGLGLVISQDLVELLTNGDKISVKSDIGKGSTFSFRLLLVSAQPIVILPEITIMPSVLKLNILVVDDNSINRQIAKKMLKDLGHQAVSVCNGQEAVDFLIGPTGSSINLVFMDSMMPVMDGYEATRTLRLMGFTTKIISMTANVFQSEKEKVKSLGCNGYVSKPIIKATLIKAIGTVMANQDYFD